MKGMKLEKLYEKGMENLKALCQKFDCLVYKYLPKTYDILIKNGLNSEYFASQWMLTLFTYDFNFRFATRIFDLFLTNGWPIIAGVMISLLKNYEGINN